MTFLYLYFSIHRAKTVQWAFFSQYMYSTGTPLNSSILSHICTIPSLHTCHLYTFSLTHIYICHHNSIQEGYPDSCFFLFLHENMRCWYSLEASQWDASNEYHNQCFYIEMWKILQFLVDFFGQFQFDSWSHAHNIFWKQVISLQVAPFFEPYRTPDASL